MKTKAKIGKLLENNEMAAYWSGLIAADGCILDNKRIKLALKDKDQLKKFADFLEVKYGGQDCVSAQDEDQVSKFCQLFDFRPSKTYNPPRLFTLEGDRFLAFLIGFIDGDGSIRYQTGRDDCLMSVKCHRSWLGLFRVFHKHLSVLCETEMPEPKINGCGYAEWHVTNSIVLKFLKRKAKAMSLPCMKRKWDKIDLDRISRREQGNINRDETLRLYAAGHRQKEICEILGLKKAAVCMIVKRNKK